MTLQIANHEFARHLVLDHSFLNAVIIHDPNDEYDTVKELRRYTLRHIYLEFFDIKAESDKYRYATQEDIERVLSWYRDLRRDPFRHDDGNVVVTCTAGISRSAAIAFVLGCSVQSPEVAVRVWNPRLHYPNPLIVRLGAEILGKPEMIQICNEFLADRCRQRMLKGKTPKQD